MELQGKIIAALQKRGGTTQKGTDWEAQSYVIETQGNHPRRMCFDVFGADRIERLAIQEGETLTVLFDIDARESNGRWWNTAASATASAAAAAADAGARLRTRTALLKSQAHEL